MRSIREFFGKIQNKHFQEIQLRADVVEIIARHIRTTLTSDQISFSPKILILRGLDQSAKSAVFIKKSGILKDLAAAMPKRMIGDIKFH